MIKKLSVDNFETSSFDHNLLNDNNNFYYWKKMVIL